jgi:hypothetical protein
MGATRVIAIQLAAKLLVPVSNVFELVNRCYILRLRTEAIWRSECDLVIELDVGIADWYSFDRTHGLDRSRGTRRLGGAAGNS